MGDNHLVELLNGIEGYDSRYIDSNGPEHMTEEFFIDENGIPTDSFLQSLKQSEKVGSSHDMKVSESYSRAQPQQLYHKKHPGSKKVANDENIHINPKQIYEEEFSDSDEEFLHDFPRFSSRKTADPSLRKKSSSNPPSRRLYDPDSQCRKQKSKKAAFKKHVKQAPRYGAHDCYRGSRAGNAVSSSAEGLRTSRQQGTGDVNADYEAKLKAMRLRVKGQLETIRALEAQLAEATHTLATKDVQLAEAFKRLLVLEKKEKLRVRAAQDEEKQLAAGSGKLRTEESKVFQLKTEMVALQAKLNDEQHRRQRAEERVQLMKAHVEKTKIRAQSAEEMSQNQSSTIEELQGKLQRLKRDWKGASNAVSAEKARAIEGQTELFKANQRAEKAERTIRDLYHENDRLKEDLRSSRMDLAAVEERSRRGQLELEVLRERNAASRTADRLKSASSAGTASPSALDARRGGDRGRDLYKDAFKATTSVSRRSSSTPATATTISRSRQDRPRGTMNGWVDSEPGNESDESSNFDKHHSYVDINHSRRYQHVISVGSESDNYDYDQDQPSRQTGKYRSGRSVGGSRYEEEEGSIASVGRASSVASRSKSLEASRRRRAQHADSDGSDGESTSIRNTIMRRSSASPPRKTTEDNSSSAGARGERKKSASPPRRKTTVDESETLTPNGARLQYDRLQKMYERVTGRR